MEVETKEVSVTVAKETHEVFDALAEIVRQAKLALKDGFQPGQDIPAIVLGSFNKLTVALDGMGKVPADLKGNTPAFIQAVATGGGQVGAELAKDA